MNLTRNSWSSCTNIYSFSLPPSLSHYLNFLFHGKSYPSSAPVRVDSSFTSFPSFSSLVNSFYWIVNMEQNFLNSKSAHENFLSLSLSLSTPSILQLSQCNGKKTVVKQMTHYHWTLLTRHLKVVLNLYIMNIKGFKSIIHRFMEVV